MSTDYWNREIETMPRERLRALQGERLRSAVAYAYERVPLYRQRMDEAGIAPGDVKGVDDLARLPFTTKSDLRDHYPFGLFAVPREQVLRIHASSGTRGKPTVVAYTAHDVDVFAEVNARSIGCAGGTSDDVLHVAYGYGLFTGGLGLHYGGERIGATVVPASGGNAGFQVELLADLGADGIACTPSFALLLAERAAAEGLLSRIRLRYGILGAEPWSEGMREKLEAAWPNFDACDIYGLSEVIGPGVAMECREGKGALHVFDDHFYPEVVEPETGEPTDGLGELVLTTLTKEALPVIRYRTGDVTQLLPGDCPCGRTHPRIARFSGRVDDMLVVRGVNVFPSAVRDVVGAFAPRVSGHILVKPRAAGVKQDPPLPVAVELAPGTSADAALADGIRARLRDALLVQTDVELVPWGSLGRSEYKSRLVQH